MCCQHNWQLPFGVCRQAQIFKENWYNFSEVEGSSFFVCVFKSSKQNLFTGLQILAVMYKNIELYLH